VLAGLRAVAALADDQQRPQPGLLLARQPAELHALTTELGPAALHHRQHLQHAVVDRTPEAGALLGERGRALRLLALDGEPAQHPGEVAEQGPTRPGAGRGWRSWSR
jgi:hypothetical protein